MWPFKKETKFHVCSETDETGLLRLGRVLDAMGAVLIREYKVLVGSQDVLFRTYKIVDKEIGLEIETYEGVTVFGVKMLVDRIREEYEKTKL